MLKRQSGPRRELLGETKEAEVERYYRTKKPASLGKDVGKHYC